MPDRASCALLTDDTEVTPWTPRTSSVSPGPTSSAWCTTESFRLTWSEPTDDCEQSTSWLARLVATLGSLEPSKDRDRAGVRAGETLGPKVPTCSLGVAKLPIGPTCEPSTSARVKDASRSACESQHLHLRSSRAGLLHARDRAGAAGPWYLGPVTGDSRLGYADLSSRSPSDFACGVKTML